jgi:phospholipase C
MRLRLRLHPRTLVAVGLASTCAVAGAVYASGCGGSSDTGGGPDASADSASSPPDGGTSGDGNSPWDAGPPHTNKLPIKHVVFLIKENRTFDVYFGKFPGANGVTTGTVCDGGTQPLMPLLDKSTPDITHAWAAALTSYNDGGMNCFDQITAAKYPDSGAPLGYQVASQADIPNYWQLAQQFVLSDNFYSSLHGPSFPNHLYTLAAQSGGVEDNPTAAMPLNPLAPTVGPCGNTMSCPEPGEAGLEPTDIPPLAMKKGVWGCDADPKERVTVLDQEGEVVELYPCFDFPTLADELTAAGVSWKMYAPQAGAYDGGFQGSGGYIWSTFDAIRHIRDTPDWAAHVVPTEQFAIDAKAGNLADVTWITTPTPVSEHTPASVCEGENWTVSLLNALGSGPNWNDSAMFITWDDFGGFYDHQAPEQIDKFGLGFRVPLLVVSPYAKQGMIDHTRAEFSSVLKFIETNWDLPSLTERDSQSPDMTQVFDFTQAPRALPALTERPACPTF